MRSAVHGTFSRSSDGPLPTCPVCNEGVELEFSKTDEKGVAIHEDCYWRKIRITPVEKPEQSQ
jgi:hypothetical protein